MVKFTKYRRNNTLSSPEIYFGIRFVIQQFVIQQFVIPKMAENVILYLGISTTLPRVCKQKPACVSAVKQTPGD